VDVRVRGDRVVVWPVQVVARALTNLVQNALHASAPDARVALQDGTTPDDDVRLAVVDAGVGMSPETLSRAGEPFFTEKPPGVGTGLGLFVVRSTMEQLGGRLTLRSVRGRGTTAEITLPRDVLAPRGEHG
jgi:two-component system sensor histidine kinase RegB